MRKLFFFFCTVLLLSFFNASAKSSLLVYTMYSDTIRKAIPDTIPYVMEEDDLESDSTTYFPANDLYSLWDTINIHSPKFNYKELESERELTLCNEQSCGYVHPFLGNVTSSFGPRKRKFHYGMDIDLETGDQVVAAFDGKVRIAKKSNSYGNVIVIRHSNGLETYYAHLSKINVEVDQNVFAGETIGLGGNTGRSRGSHLHFEIRYLGQPINPTEMISFNDCRLISDTFCLSKKTFNYYDQVYKIAQNNAKHRVYVVKKGDTLSGIAKKHGVSVKSLTQKNKIKVKSTLHPGQRLKT